MRKVQTMDDRQGPLMVIPHKGEPELLSNSIFLFVHVKTSGRMWLFPKRLTGSPDFDNINSKQIAQFFVDSSRNDRFSHVRDKEIIILLGADRTHSHDQE